MFFDNKITKKSALTHNNVAINTTLRQSENIFHSISEPFQISFHQCPKSLLLKLTIENLQNTFIDTFYTLIHLLHFYTLQHDQTIKTSFQFETQQ